MPNDHNKQDLERLKKYAKDLYVNDKLMQDEVSVKTGVHVNTISRWAAAGGWKKLRRNYILTRTEQLANLLDELGQLNASIREKPDGLQFADSKQADIRRKLVRDITTLEGSASIGEACHTAKGILEYIRRRDLSKAQEMAQWMDGYIRSLTEINGIVAPNFDVD